MSQKQQISKRRYNYIYWLKAITMLLVIVGHTLPDDFLLRSWVYSINVPLFFFMSGLFLKYDNLGVCIKSKAQRLLIPYIQTGLVLIFFSLLIAARSVRAFSNSSIKESLKNIATTTYGVVYGSGMDHFNPFRIVTTGPIWFLLSLFWSLLIVMTVLHFIKDKPTIQLVIMIITFVLGLFTSKYIWLPFSIQSGMTASVYVFLGYEFKHSKYFELKIHKIWFLAVILVVWVIASLAAGTMVIANNTFSNLPLNIISSLLGIIFMVGLAQNLEIRMQSGNHKLYNWMLDFGKNTMIILCVHSAEQYTLPWVKAIGFASKYINDYIVIFFAVVARLILFVFIFWIYKNMKKRIVITQQ